MNLETEKKGVHLLDTVNGETMLDSDDDDDEDIDFDAENLTLLSPVKSVSAANDIKQEHGYRSVTLL